LPTKKKPTKKVEQEPKEECCAGPMGFGDLTKGFKANVKDMMPKETQMHIFRGFSEFALAMDSMIPWDQMPSDVRDHGQAAKREMLLMLRSMIDSQLSNTPGPTKESKLQKIKVE
jgi:hypothetical protein